MEHLLAKLSFCDLSELMSLAATDFICLSEIAVSQVDCDAVVGGPLIDLPDEMGWWLSIYLNMTIPFDGQIHR